MSHSICFVTPQIYPGTSGGIGRLIGANALTLYEAGWFISFLLDISPEALQTFRAYLKQHLPNAIAYSPDELLTHLRPTEIISPKSFRSEGYYRAYRLALALVELTHITSLDGVELVDYLGHGYVIAQWRKLLGPSLDNILMWVRLHGTSELCQRAESAADLSYDNQLHFLMERYTLANVDAWLGPSPTLGSWYQTYYQIDCPQFYHRPHFEQLGPGNSHPRAINPDKLRLLFYGKVQALKGADTFVQAAIHLCQEFPERIDFDLVGGEDEGLVARFGSYQEKLLALIPPEYRDRFHFHGPIQPEMLPRFTQQGTAAVIPSKFETFCLAAHELNWIGIPLILNELPAFADYFVSGDNCLKFDGTVEHLVEVVQQILTAREPFTDWTWNAAALDVDPVATYEALLTTPPRPAPIVEPSEPATISVIIQHAGSLEKLQRCLDSLVANTYQPHQVIIKAENQKLEVQDLASANTFDLELTSKGMAALQQVTGDYILPLTSDHWLHPHFLQQMTITLRRVPTAEVITTYRQEQNHGTDDEDTARYILPYEATFPLLLYENLFSRSGTLCKRDIFDRFTDQMTPLAGNDWDFWLALVRADISIEIIPLVLLYQETFTVSGEINQMGQALITSHLLVRHPALVQKYALELLNIYAFELQNKERTFNHERKVFTTIQKEWTFRFNSQHIITRRFVQLTHLNILKAVRNPSIAWHKLRQWWQEQSSKGTE